MLFAAGGIIPLSVAALFLIVLPESPRYLGRFSARHGEIRTLAARLSLSLPANADLAEPIPETGKGPGVRALFADGMARDTLCLWGMGFFGYMTSYVILTWAPSMLAGQGLSLAVTSQSLSAWSLGGFGSPLIGLAVQRWGSRIAIGTFALAAAAGTLVMMSLPLTEDRIGYFLVMLFVENLFVVSLLTAVYFMGTHLYPASIRATGTGAASAFGRLGATASSFTTVYALEWGGTVGYFSAMGVTALLCFCFAMGIVNHVQPARAEGRDKTLAAPVPVKG